MKRYIGKKIKFSVLENETENFIFLKKDMETNKIKISKKDEKKANKRNKVKRRIKEIIRKINKKEKVEIIVKGKIINKKFIEIKKEIEKKWNN